MIACMSSANLYNVYGHGCQHDSGMCSCLHDFFYAVQIYGLLDAYPIYCGKSGNRDWIRATYNK